MSNGSPFLSSYSKSPSQYLLTSDDTAVWGDISMELCQDHSEGIVSRCDIPPIGLRKDSFEMNNSNSYLSLKQLKDKVFPAWRSVKAFVFIICILITVHGTLATGYSMSVLTTIEKRFNIASKTAGFIISSYEFGTLLSVVFVSYFGSRGHIPRWIGFGGLVLSFGSFLFSLPHFIATPYAASFLNITKEVFLSTFKITPFVQKPELCKLNDTFVNDTCSPVTSIPIGNYVFILSLAQILLGVGGSPLLTLGTAYIDNHVEKDSSSVYLGEYVSCHNCSCPPRDLCLMNSVLPNGFISSSFR
ncbi:unnamed protein product [Soboliphyme baturini]|uniref:MFS domain-containing protein n=1 Tax=Soboliphyme baturini TaxID=241478 RepID=A0A183J9U1_9BILA|nr:unnamed protein product [Soboliphyme baturini]